MNDIKIFVSRRLDLNSVIIPNPIYVPIICGAVYASQMNNLQGDNLGDNISSLRNNFCEFTVQYWAWKNEIADYYGLCHYRRYLIFANKCFKENSQRQVMEGLLDKKTIQKYDLLNENGIKKYILMYDAVVNVAANVQQIPTPIGYQSSVYDHWAAHGGVFFDKRVLPLLLETIHRLCPQYDTATAEYLHGKWHRGYNCYVMKKALFFQMCQFQFTVLFDLEKQLENNGYAKNFERTLGYMGEIMYGIFIYYLQRQESYKIKEVQLVYFEQTVLPDSQIQRLVDRFLFWAKFRFEDFGYKILPKGSRRRDFVKKIYFSLVKR